MEPTVYRHFWVYKCMMLVAVAMVLVCKARDLMTMTMVYSVISNLVRDTLEVVECIVEAALEDVAGYLMLPMEVIRVVDLLHCIIDEDDDQSLWRPIHPVDHQHIQHVKPREKSTRTEEESEKSRRKRERIKCSFQMKLSSSKRVNSEKLTQMRIIVTHLRERE